MHAAAAQQVGILSTVQGFTRIAEKGILQGSLGAGKSGKPGAGVFGVMIWTSPFRKGGPGAPGDPGGTSPSPKVARSGGGLAAFWNSDAPRTTVCTARVAPPISPRICATDFTPPVHGHAFKLAALNAFFAADVLVVHMSYMWL
jgi:hypothetical protein